MAYTKQTWADGFVGGTPITAARLGHIEDGIEAAHGLAGATNPRLGILKVASSHAPADVKAQADYVCTGTDDQTVINAALLAASRPADGFGGIGAGCVELVGPNFFTGHNGGVITMYPATWLRGSGYGTLIQPSYATFSGLGAIELVNDTTDHTFVSDLSIGKPNSNTSRCHGFRYVQSGVGDAYELDSGSDPFNRISDVNIFKPQGHGVWVSGTSSGNRETHVDHVLAWDTGLSGFRIESSDSKFTACTAQAGSGGSGFYIAGGNSKLAQCKAYYTDGSFDGYEVVSSRAEIVGCSAQDNGRWGFNISSTDCTVVGCVADSNARLDAAGGGFQIGGSGLFADLSAFDRGQTPASPQLQGIVFSASPQVFLTGRVKVPSGTAHVVGSPGANSYMRVVRDGATVLTAG